MPSKSAFGIGCPGSLINPALPTEASLAGEGWKIIAFAKGTNAADGMFDGNLELAPGSAFGTPPQNLTSFDHLNTNDFQIDFTNLVDSTCGNEILFITGDHQVWGYMHYQSAWPHNGTNPLFNQVTVSGQGSRCSGGNAVFYTCDGTSTGIKKNCGHILYRGVGTLEDPWVSIANGDHMAGYSNTLMVWGENNFDNAGKNLKNAHEGMKVCDR